MKNRIVSGLLLCLLGGVFLVGCGNLQTREQQSEIIGTTETEPASNQEAESSSREDAAGTAQEDTEASALADAKESGEPSKDSEVSSAETTDISDAETTDAENADVVLVPGTDQTFDEWMERPLGSASLFSDRTVIVSIFLEEPSISFSEEEKEKVLERQVIAYEFIMNSLKDYGKNHELIYDWSKDPELSYDMKIAEDIPAYVTTEQEHEMDEKEDRWIAQIPTMDLLQKYDTDSIAYILFVPHEGVSYSSMHFIEDGKQTWHEICLIYLKDYYSKTLDYETPAVYAHELLHLFGAEDFYKEAGVFDASVYEYAYVNYRNDIMIDQWETIGGKAVTCQTAVKQKITPLTAMLLGIVDEPEIEKACPELKREQKACFPGHAYDRPF